MVDASSLDVFKVALGPIGVMFTGGADKAIIKRISQLEVAWMEIMMEVHRVESLKYTFTNAANAHAEALEKRVSQLREYTNFIDREIVRLQEVLVARRASK